LLPSKLLRVFKKSSPNCKVTVYLGKRDFVDHLDHVDPVDGVILVDPEYLKDRKVFVTLTCAFRYGREDLDVLGLSFRKDLYISTFQAFPPVPEERKPNSRLQERLLKKLGQHAHPFYFTIPQNLPCSVTLQPGPEDTGKACGVDFEIRAFCAKSIEEKIHKRNSVRLVIRKVQYAPEKPGPQPMVETTRNFLMSDRSLHLEASLDKELYYHGEPISVNVHVTNNSTKTVKRVKISVRQYADICLFSTAQYKCPVAQLEADDQVSSSSTFCKVYTLTPTLDKNREKRGLALDGKLKHEDTNLASSTIVKDVTNKEVLGILVSYRVKVKLVVSRGGYDTHTHTHTHTRGLFSGCLSVISLFIVMKRRQIVFSSRQGDLWKEIRPPSRERKTKQTNMEQAKLRNLKLPVGAAQPLLFAAAAPHCVCFHCRLL
uniref:Arrestin red cell n=1 Tax=Mastacembelus armatus TaxID=205130 RepID=A0A7N8YDD9_9TELE